MEEFVGQLWHNWITRKASTHYPDAAVTLPEIEKIAGILFRALGGDPGLGIAAAATQTHAGARGWLQRMAGTGDRQAQAGRDGETLRLPPRIDCFPNKALNRDLYLWLAALASCPEGADLPWFRRNQLASQAALKRYPGLVSRYRRLVEAHLSTRLDTGRLTPDEAAQEAAIRAALHEPGSVACLPPLTSHKSRPPQPVPLWLLRLEERFGDADLGDGAQGNGGQGAQASLQNEAQKAEHVTTPENSNPLVFSFRAESLPSWAEYIRVNRSFDEDENPNAEQAAQDLDKLSLTRDGESGRSRIRFDFDLPSAAEDDLPLGPGIPLPEWDYRKGILIPDHCRVQPMLADQAEASVLPAHLSATARRLRQQFASLLPARHWLKAQPEGTELDIDACVRRYTDRRCGLGSLQLGGYLDPVHQERDLACLLLADLSMSTDTWINDRQRIVDVIQETLLLFSEALSASGDRFGIYGFSSLRRQNIRFHLLKDFGERYDDAARGRILAIKPGYYTRMGGAIRQASRILAEQAAGRRLLLILTDGKPNDLDVYDSRYGLEDTRMAVIEAKRQGLTPFCVTIDRDGNAYLPHIFGPAGYCLIRNPEELPQRLPTLYTQLRRV